MKKLILSFPSVLLLSMLFVAPQFSMAAGPCSAHPRKLSGTFTGRIDLRNGANWMYETMNGTIELTLNSAGTAYAVTSLNGQAAVQGNVQGCWVSANINLSPMSTFGTLNAGTTIATTSATMARVFGQIDLHGNFWSMSSCPWGTSTSLMNHLGPLLGLGQNEIFVCEEGKPAKLVGNSSGVISSGGRAQYQWNLVETP